MRGKRRGLNSQSSGFPATARACQLTPILLADPAIGVPALTNCLQKLGNALANAKRVASDNAQKIQILVAHIAIANMITDTATARDFLNLRRDLHRLIETEELLKKLTATLVASGLTNICPMLKIRLLEARIVLLNITQSGHSRQLPTPVLPPVKVAGADANATAQTQSDGATAKKAVPRWWQEYAERCKREQAKANKK